MKLCRVYPLFLVSLTLFMIIPSLTPKAHATTPTLFASVQSGPCGTLSVFGCTAPTINNVLANMVVIISDAGNGGGGCGPSSAVKDNFGSTYTNVLSVSEAGNMCTFVYTTTLASSGNLIVSFTGSQNSGTSATQVIVDVFSGVLSIGNSAHTTTSFTSCAGGCSSSVSLTINSGSLVWELLSMLGDQINTTNCGTLAQNSGQFLINNYGCQSFAGGSGTCGAGCGQLLQGQSIYTPASSSSGTNTYTETFTLASTCASGTASNCFNLENFGIELRGSGGASIPQLTQCYGNCGNPPITLVNTNSTHSINFNQSITLFYEFQSNLNGFIINASTNIAKPYLNGQQVSLGIYEASCNVGVTPFTSSCPGQLQSSLNGNINPVKGRTTLTPSSLSVGIGEWVAVAVTGVFSGLDLNDTNTNVALFQQNGRIPQILSGAVTSGCTCKMGLWIFLIGNTVVTGPPPITISCGADLVCLLLQSVLALTPTNPLLGAIAMGIIYSIITIVALSAFMWKFGMETALPSGIYLLIFVAWMTFWASLVGALWFIILEILVTILIFSSFFGQLASGTFQHRGRRDA